MDEITKTNLATFLNPTIRILKEMTGVEAIPRDVSVRKCMFPSSEIAVVIGITGEWRGAFVISASKDVAHSVASKLMGGLDTSQLGNYDIAEAIAEYGNIVAGNAMISLEQNGDDVNISPPTIIIGQGEELRIGGFTEMLIAVLDSELGEIAVSLTMVKV